MHDMILGVLGAHGQEGAGPHMQRHPMAGDAARYERGEKRGREMEARGRRGDGALIPRIDGLIIGAVAVIGGAARGDVRRQRHVAQAGDGLVERRPREIEGQGHLALLASRFDGGGKLAQQADPAGLAEQDAVAPPSGAWPDARAPASAGDRAARSD